MKVGSKHLITAAGLGVTLGGLGGPAWAAVTTVSNAELSGSGATATTDLLVDASSPATLTLTGAILSAQSLNVTKTGAVTVANGPAAAASSLVLGNTGTQNNLVTGSNALDLLYVADGSSLTLGGPGTGSGTGSLGLRLIKTGNIDVASTAATPTTTLTISGDVIQGGNTAGTTGATIQLTKTGAGTALISGNITGNPTSTGSTSSTNSITVSAGTLILSGDNVGRKTLSTSSTGNQNQSTIIAAGATLQLQANAGNTTTTPGVSTALGRENTQFVTTAGSATNNAPYTTGVIRFASAVAATPSTVQLRSDSDVTFAGFNYASLALNAQVVIDVGSLTGTTTNKTISIAPGSSPTPTSGTPGLTGSGATINVNGSSGYKLAIGNLFLRGSNTVLANSADVVIGGVVDNSTTTSASNVTLNLNGTSTTGNSSVDGVITTPTDGSGTVSVGKGGTGTWALSNANLYGGNTTVSNGKLLVKNSSGSATGTGAVNVGITPGVTNPLLTPTVGGTGTSYGAFTATSNTVVDPVTFATYVSTATIAPGLNPVGNNFGLAGTLGLGTGGTVGSVTTAGGMTLTSTVLDFDLASTAAGVSDRILTGGAFAATTTVFNFNELVAGTLETGVPYTLVSGFTNAPDISGITGVVIAGDYTPSFAVNGGSLQVTFTSVPEPMALGLIGMAGLLVGRRRRA